METAIHDVNKIALDTIRKLREDEIGIAFTRYIWVETERGEKLKITCFGKTKEDLQIEVEESRKI